jgi:hypothetical protein
MFDSGAMSEERIASLRQKVKDNILSPQDQAMQDARREWLKLKAVRVKEEGNELLTKQKQYEAALAKYLEALEMFTEGRDGQGAFKQTHNTVRSNALYHRFGDLPMQRLHVSTQAGKVCRSEKRGTTSG